MDIVVDMLKQKLREDGIYLIKVAVIYLMLVLLAFAITQPVGKVLEEREVLMAAKDEAIPLVVLEFVGMQKLGQFPADVEVFFLCLMILNLGVMTGLFVHGILAMRESFEKNRFSFFVMQIMPLWKNYVFVLAEIMLKAVLSWELYILAVRVFYGFLIADLHIDDRLWLQALMDDMGARGVLLALFMTALGMLFGMSQCRRVHSVDIGLGIVGVVFLIGNLYKIPQYIVHMQEQGIGDVEKTTELVDALRNLRIICPFSWLNPVNIYNGTLKMSQLWIYGVLAILLFVTTGLWYCKRDWREL